MLHYPSDAEIARRFNIDRSTVRKYRQRSNVEDRRSRVQERTEALVDEQMATTAAAAIVEGRSRVMRICDKYLARFEQALDDGKLRADSVADLNTVFRLMEFASGGADSRTQQEATVTLEAVQQRFRERRVVYAAETAQMGVPSALPAAVPEALPDPDAEGE